MSPFKQHIASMLSEKSEAEYLERQEIIDRIKRRAGSLVSVPWDKVSTADLYTLLKAVYK